MAGSVDAGRALTKLTEVSSQIEGAVILDEAGGLVASSFATPGTGERVAAAVRALLEAAGRRLHDGRAPLSRLLVETEGGAVVAVRSGGRAIAAVTGPEPTVGLVSYDLKVTLRDAQAASMPEAETRPSDSSVGEPGG